MRSEDDGDPKTPHPARDTKKRTSNAESYEAKPVQPDDEHSRHAHV